MLKRLGSPQTLEVLGGYPCSPNVYMDGNTPKYAFYGSHNTCTATGHNYSWGAADYVSGAGSLKSAEDLVDGLANSGVEAASHFSEGPNWSYASPYESDPKSIWMFEEIAVRNTTTGKYR